MEQNGFKDATRLADADKRPYNSFETRSSRMLPDHGDPADKVHGTVERVKQPGLHRMEKFSDAYKAVNGAKVKHAGRRLKR